MRILFSSSYVYKSHNGAAIFAQLFLKWAEENSHTVDVVSIENNDTFIQVNQQASAFPIIYQKNISKAIYSKIKSLDYSSYDLIYFNNVIESAVSVKKLDHKNIIGFLHDSQYMNDVYPHQTIKRKLFRKILKGIEKRAISKLKKVHTNSEQMLDQINKIYSCPKDKIEFLYFSSLDLHPKVKIPTSHFTILFIKTNYTSGGLFTLLNAVQKLSFPSKVIAVGPAKKDHELIRNKYSEINITFHAYKSRSDIGVLFAESDVFITPAFSEPMGIGNFEAMKMDVPVIGNDIEGIREIAQKSKAILLFKSNDADDLALKIQELKSDDKLKRELIQNGRKFIKEKLAKDIVFEKLNRIIK